MTINLVLWHEIFLGLFQKLFRQDLLVASLFRNFLLAERIMRSYNCTPVSYPSLPTCYHHPMWQAWDLALDHIVGQLPALLEGKATYEVSCSELKILHQHILLVAQPVFFSAIGSFSSLASQLFR